MTGTKHLVLGNCLNLFFKKLKFQLCKIFQLISNENAKKELGEVDDLTEEKVDKVVEGFLEDVKENLIETKGWPVNISAYIVSEAALNAHTRVLAKKYPKIAINSVSPGYTSTDLNHNSGVLTV